MSAEIRNRNRNRNITITFSNIYPSYTFQPNGKLACILTMMWNLPQHQWLVFLNLLIHFMPLVSLYTYWNFLFRTTGLFLYPLRTSEKLRFSDVLRGYRKRPVVWNKRLVFWGYKDNHKESKVMGAWYTEWYMEMVLFQKRL